MILYGRAGGIGNVELDKRICLKELFNIFILISNKGLRQNDLIGVNKPLFRSLFYKQSFCTYCKKGLYLRSKFLNHTSRLCVHEARGVFVREMELLRSYNLKAPFGDPDGVGCYNHDGDFEAISSKDYISELF